MTVSRAPKIKVLNAATIDTYCYTEADLLEYATFIGLDTELDRDLLWIARAGLYAGLPQPWVTCQAEGSKEIFYFNPESRVSTFEHPSDDFYRELLAQTLCDRVTVTVTLKAEQISQQQGFVTLVGTMISGSEVLRLRMSTREMFADVRQRMTDVLKLPKNAVARFCFEGDCSVLGRSDDINSVGTLLGLPDVDAAELGSFSAPFAHCARDAGARIVPKFSQPDPVLDACEALRSGAFEGVTLLRL
jgi:centrosomal protein CEP164